MRMRGGRERYTLHQIRATSGARPMRDWMAGMSGLQANQNGSWRTWQPRWSRVATGRVATASPLSTPSKLPRRTPALPPRLYTSPPRHAAPVPLFFPSPSFPRPGLQLCFPFYGCPLFPCPLRPCQATVH